MQANPARQPPLISVFLIVTFAWSWGIWGAMRAMPSLTPHSHAWGFIYVAALCGPLIGAFVASLLNAGFTGIREWLRCLAVPRVHWAVYLLAIAFPPAIWILSAFIERGQFSFGQSWMVLLVVWAKMLIRGGPLTEEVGWRGFLLPRLMRRMNLFWASVVIMAVWGIWHLPLWFVPGLPHTNWSFGLFMLFVAPLTLLFSWFYVKGSGSVWLPILFHTSINFSLYFSWIEPGERSGPAFYFLDGIFWVLAVVMVLCNRQLWFSRPARKEVASISGQQDLVAKPYGA
jgi:membrane protease YdiL (CAAX protease family)